MAQIDRPNKFFQVSFSFAGKPGGISEFKLVELEPVMDQIAPDWFRFGGNCWIIYSDKIPQEIYEACKHLLVVEEDRMFAVEINPNNRQGWMSKLFWDWLNKTR